ncbi:DUF948 domain-containing protein [Desulfuribacillus alkaliarsenatis]|uniref:DUF948 domain-containing protein n=1 Tax=Desulfuribacillus alkaliarsenatis TaxID=766136 RepID=A0A1E5G053_9FIRM|nr:DUF948 domain-containing protein [Desulfuribacillus alkaliarsenatis]OEF95857.1 hypothetical protein BHF68_10705 [Desulfuribacillus alkaliarsenatis]
MEITISLSTLGYFILFALLAVFMVYAIIVLYRVSQVMKQAEAVLDKNTENINRILETAPEILENINDTTDLILHSVNKADSAIDSIGTSLTETAATIREGTSEAASYIHVITEIVGLIKALFGKK